MSPTSLHPTQHSTAQYKTISQYAIRYMKFLSTLLSFKFHFRFISISISVSVLFFLFLYFHFGHFVDQSTGFFKMPIKLSSLDPAAGVWL